MNALNGAGYWEPSSNIAGRHQNEKDWPFPFIMLEDITLVTPKSFAYCEWKTSKLKSSKVLAQFSIKIDVKNKRKIKGTESKHKWMKN